MQKRPLPFGKHGGDLNAVDVPSRVQDFLHECDYKGVSPATLSKYRTILNNLSWFLSNRAQGTLKCGRSELQAFLLYVRRGHEDEGGRWGQPRATKPASRSTEATYFTVLKTFFRFLVTAEYLDESPVERMAKPIHRQDQVEPFSSEQIERFIAAAKKSNSPRRNEAILLLLLDTGMRASELCALRMCDIDLDNKRCRVLGKGGKYRAVRFGKDTGRALYNYLKETAAERSETPDSPLFLSDRGRTASEAMTRSGLSQLIERLGKTAGIKNARCSPHTFRHTFAIMFLRRGGDSLSLQTMLVQTHFW